jgi:hypothetical protein
MIIAFTGHRDKNADPADLASIAAQHPGATWIHGGADGFDTQVQTYAEAYNIPQEIHLPDYKTYKRRAPLIRNEAMMAKADMVVALYDGRPKGGTTQAIRCAYTLGKLIYFINPVRP